MLGRRNLSRAQLPLLGHRTRHGRLRRYLRRERKQINWAATDEVPQQPREAGPFLHDIEIGAAGEERTPSISCGANEAGVLHSPELIRPFFFYSAHL